MEKENKFSVLNAFKHDKVVWGIVAAVSVILLVCSGYSLPVSMIYVGVGVACAVLLAHIPHKYFKLGVIPLVAMTIALMAVGYFIAPIDGRWLLLGSVAFNPLHFASLSVCLLLTVITILKDNKQKMIWVLLLIAICALCYALDMIYAPTLAVIAILGMLLLGIYRKAVTWFVCVIIIVDILAVGSAFLLGRTVEERNSGSVAQTVELPATIQTRVDNLKECTVNLFDSDAVEAPPTQNETEVANTHSTNILAASYHNIYTHAGILGCVAMTLLYIFVFCRVIYRLESSSSKFAKALMLCCSIALILDSGYNACIVGHNYPNVATSAMVQYVMFGVILSCLSSCDKASTGRIKVFFKTMTEER